MKGRFTEPAVSRIKSVLLDRRGLKKLTVEADVRNESKYA